MRRKSVISALVAPFLVCLVLVPLRFAMAEQIVAAGINQQAFKAAAELKTPERLKNWAPLRLSQASLHPLKERE